MASVGASCPLQGAAQRGGARAQGWRLGTSSPAAVPCAMGQLPAVCQALLSTFMTHFILTSVPRSRYCCPFLQIQKRSLREVK